MIQMDIADQSKHSSFDGIIYLKYHYLLVWLELSLKIIQFLLTI